MSEGSQPWDRMPEEPARWFARFERFRLLGGTRSIEEAWRLEEDEADALKGAEGRKRALRPGGPWYQMAKRWDWKRRAEAWDRVERVEREQREKERRRVIQDRALSLAEKMLSKVEQMIDTPLFMEKEAKEGGTIQVPARWNFESAAKLTRAALDLLTPTGRPGESDDGEELPPAPQMIVFERGDEPAPHDPATDPQTASLQREP